MYDKQTVQKKSITTYDRFFYNMYILSTKNKVQKTHIHRIERNLQEDKLLHIAISI